VDHISRTIWIVLDLPPGDHGCSSREKCLVVISSSGDMYTCMCTFHYPFVIRPLKGWKLQVSLCTYRVVNIKIWVTITEFRVCEGSVTKFRRQRDQMCTLKLIAQGELTFDEKVVVYLVQRPFLTTSQFESHKSETDLRAPPLQQRSQTRAPVTRSSLCRPLIHQWLSARTRSKKNRNCTRDHL